MNAAAPRRRSSRLSGFYERSLADRQSVVSASLSNDLAKWLTVGGLDVGLAETMSENVVTTMGLPFAIATNFTIDGHDLLIPMATEEPSVVAAASNAARLVREMGGFFTQVDDAITEAQIHVDGAAKGAIARIHASADQLLAVGNAAIPKLVARGGGCRHLAVRVLDENEGALVVEIALDVRDAMGANLADTVAEAVAPDLERLTGGIAVMRILSNLCSRRLARATCRIAIRDLGATVAERIVRATWFAARDVGRAATHNKGIMNGIDAVAMACGQDTRAIEAGAHAYAARSGHYMPLTNWQLNTDHLIGTIELPMAVGIVGATTTMPSSRAAMQIMDVQSSRQLAGIIAAVGLASNFAALRALVSEGIQQGHMRLHERREQTV